MYEWNIDRKLGFITLDNCTTNDVVIRELLYKFKHKGVIRSNGRVFQVRCTAHILNLVVQYGLTAIQNVIEKVRAAVKFITRSPQRQRKFEEVCDQVAHNSKNLVADVPTRWNSTYSMLESTLAFKDGLSRFVDIETKFRCAPSGSNWQNAQTVCDCLKVFFDATKIVSGTKYTTVNRYFDLSCGIKLQIDEWCIFTNSFVKKMALKMKKKFDKYWDNTLFSIEGNTDEDCSAGSSSTFASTIKSFESFLKKSSQSILVKTDLEMYLEETTNPLNIGKGLVDDTFDILGWWKYNEPKYPVIGKIARDILAIPASSVALEFAFSIGGRVIDRYRSSMKSNTIEALICAQDWIRSSLKDEGLGGMAIEIVLEVDDEIDIAEDIGYGNREIHARTNVTEPDILEEMESGSEYD